MTLSLIAAIISALCLSIMVTLDQLMIKDCYKNNPDHAWIVCSVTGSIFGLMATFITWLLYSIFSPFSLSDIYNQFLVLMYPTGLIMIFAGIINIQVMRHYFRLFIAKEGDETNETAIAMWLSTAPIFIFITLFIIYKILNYFNLNLNFDFININPVFGFAVITTVLAIISFEKYSQSKSKLQFSRVKEVAKMLGAIVVYTIIVSYLLNSNDINSISVLALQPFYWLGFIAAARLLLRKDNYQSFVAFLPSLKSFIVAVILIELLGMLVYYFEFFALSGTDPTLVNLITGTHIILVFIFSVILSHYRKILVTKNIPIVTILSVPIATTALPKTTITAGRLMLLLIVISSLLWTLSLAS